MISKFDAVLSLVGYKKFREDENGEIIWEDEESLKPTEAQISVEVERLTNDEPYAILRKKRNLLLKSSDWMAVSDRTMTPEQIAYRQALRDMPANNPDVALDDAGELINITWPTEPQ